MTVITSGRSLRTQSFWTVARLLGRFALRGPAAFAIDAGWICGIGRRGKSRPTSLK
jgi:hypothetical protein